MIRALRERFSELEKRKNQFLFSKAIADVTKTKPIQSIESAQTLVVTQVHHVAVEMYLLAVKSFVLQYGPCKIEIVDDGSLTQDDLSLLNTHIENLTVVDISEIDVFNCPSGACWERLHYVLSRTDEYYVIQLDSDTVTFGALPEIYQHVIDNQGFTVGSPMFAEPVLIDYMSTLAESWNNAHIQSQAEMNLPALKTLGMTHYIRGCAAFTGFPKGSNLREKLCQVSEIMESSLGKEKWNEWGSEQFSSNVMQSLYPNSRVLKWPKYQNHEFPKYASGIKGLAGYIGKVSLIHFIGASRFSNAVYTEAVKRVLPKLM